MAWDKQKVEAACAKAYAIAANIDDCKNFVSAVAALVFTPNAFPKPPWSGGYDADKLISDHLEPPASGWVALGNDAQAATSQAEAGKIVVAAMSAAEIGQTHGHLAIVVGGTEYSGGAGKNVPRCFCGSLSAGGRVPRKVGNTLAYSVAYAFGASNVSKIRYFWKSPTATTP